MEIKDRPRPPLVDDTPMAGAATPHDAIKGHWVERMPAEIQPFLRLMRLDRPAGVWLLLLPCFWGATLASIANNQPLPNMWHLLLFTLGAFAMRGAGCCWNDYLDRDIDARVARTSNRPLAAGLVSARETLLFMAALMLFGLVVLLQFNGFTIILGILSIGLVAVYPSIKRVSDFPQIVLGLAFSWGALLGWSATFGALALAPIMLYAAAIAWAIGYDTIYALQDVEDDALLGVGSTARRFRGSAKLFVALCYSFCVVMAIAALSLANAGVLAYGGLLLFGAALFYQLLKLDVDDGASALATFRMTPLAGLAFLVGLIADGLARFF